MKTFTTFLLAGLVLAGPPMRPRSSGWAPSYISSLGVTFFDPPETGQAFSLVSGVVSEPDVLAGLGLENVAKDSRIGVTPFYAADFEVTEGGRTFIPAIIKISVDRRHVVVAPRRGSTAVIGLATGDKDAKPPSTGWAPSWTTSLDVAFSGPPEDGQAFDQVEGTVSRPAELHRLGFPDVRAGEAVSLMQDEPLELRGSTQALVRIETSTFFEVFVVEEDHRLVPITEYW